MLRFLLRVMKNKPNIVIFLSDIVINSMYIDYGALVALKVNNSVSSNATHITIT